MLNEIEARKLFDVEFKIMVVRILKELSENFEELRTSTATVGNKQSEMKDTLTEMENNLQGINTSINEA